MPASDRVRETPDYIPFDRAAGFYESTRWLPDEMRARAAGLIAQSLGATAGRPVLDAGVGTGRFARHLAEGRLPVVGIDASLPMMQQALLLCPGLRLVRGDLRRLPFADAAFAGALVVHVLHLIADWHACVRELRRVIAPGGSLFLGHDGVRELRVRDMYNRLVAERGWARPHIGAGSMEAIVGYVTGTGAEVERVDGGALRWTASETVGEALAMLRRNPFSHQWDIPPREHDALCDELERRVLSEVGPPDTVDESSAQLLIYRARWG